MAVARTSCGGCGEPLTRGQSICPQCGSPIEMPEGDVKEVQPDSSGQCPSCGHVNVNPGTFCESCGVRLRTQAPSGRGHATRKAVSKRPKGVHYQILVVVVLLSGWMIYEEWAREFPPEAETHVHTTETQGHQSELREIEALQNQLDANPGDEALRLRLANLIQDFASHDSRFYIRAVENYKQYLEKNPDAANPRVDLGICYFELSKLDSVHSGALLSLAISEMEFVYRANPDHQAAAYNLGIVTLNAGWADRSNEWFKKAIAINPQSNLGQRAQQLLEQHSFTGRSE